MLLPVRVRSLAHCHVDGVRCGGSHTVVLVRPRSPADVAADAKDVPDDDGDDDCDVKSLRGGGSAKSEFADKTIAAGSFGHSKAVNSRDDAKTQLGLEAKAGADSKSHGGKEGSVGTAEGAAPSSSSAVAQALASYETDELTAQCISWARHRRIAEIEYALSRGSDVDVKDASGNTMLIVAAQNGHRAVLEALVTLKADLNVTNAKGNSALHYLFAYGFQAEAEMLISKGADDYAQNLEGYTCYEMGLID